MHGNFVLVALSARLAFHKRLERIKRETLVAELEGNKRF